MNKRIDPMGTEPLFDSAIRDDEFVVAALFHCGLCNDLTVDEPGELCAPCAEKVLTTKPRTTRARRTAARKAVA